jgi:mannose/fructose/N-acetylgalactosamine-specific phosphotransferase system component IIC
LIAELAIPLTDKAFKEGNQKKFTTLAIFFHVLASAAKQFWIIPAVMFGGDLVTVIIEKAPAFILQGISVASGILPGIGFAVILTYLWNAKLAIFFFVGFTIMKYLGVDLMFLFVIALAIGLVDLFTKSDITNKTAVSSASSKESEEEGFLS